MPPVASDRLTQVPLRRMTRGLAKPIATIRLEPRDISSRSGIRFESAADDLDHLEAAVLRSKSGRQFALVRHQHQPNPGTDILTNENSRSLREDLQEVFRLLSLGPRDLRWIHPTIAADSLASHVETLPKRLSAKFTSEPGKGVAVLQGKMAACVGGLRKMGAKAKLRASAGSATGRRKLSRKKKARSAARARALAKKK